jgi:hypothetical protein
VAVALRGNLSDFGIGEVFQLIGQQRKTGVLEVDAPDKARIHVAFVEGAVLSASPLGPHEDAALGDMLVRTGFLTAERLLALERRVEAEEESLRRLAIQEEGLAARDVDAADELVTRETLFQLLRWTQGSFHFSAQKVRTPKPDARGTPAEQILMDGLRMVDEWRTFDPDATREDVVFRQSAPFETYRNAVRGESPRQLADAQRLYDLIDGQRPVRRVVDLSRLGTFEGARMLSALRRAGVLEAVAREQLPRAARADASAATAPPAARRLVLAALPFLLLLAAAGLAQRGPAPAPAALRPDALAAARASFSALRAQNGAEAFRFERGRWPEGLAELTAAGWNEAPRMAAPGATPYPLSVRGGGLALLAPEY